MLRFYKENAGAAREPAPYLVIPELLNSRASNFLWKAKQVDSRQNPTPSREGQWKYVQPVIGISPRYDVLEKPDPFCAARPLDCKYSNRGKFPLGSYQVEKSTCFVLVLHASSSVCFSLFFLSLCLPHKERCYFLKTDYSRVTGLICCSSRCLLTVPYDGNVVILAGQATNRKCQGGGRREGVGGWKQPSIIHANLD